MFNSIGSIGGMSGMGFLNYAQMNDMKLSLLNNKYTQVSSPSFSKPKMSEVDKAFLNDYQNAMTDLLASASALDSTNKNSILGEMGVRSSDTSVVAASARYRLTEPVSYTVDVKQLAQAQSNTTNALSASEKPTIGGAFQLKTDKGTFEFDIDPAAAKSNAEMLDAIAKEINSGKTGVTAQVIRNKGSVSLSITGTETGEDNGFQISGSFATQTGLDKVGQAAQDAVFTVDKNDGYGAQEFTSDSNKVTLGSYKIEGQLKSVGKAELSIGADTEKTANGVQKLVDSYNKAVKLLDGNSNRGLGVLKQLRNLLLLPTSEKSMKMAGISVNANGTMSFDKATFTKAMDKDPSFIGDIIGGSRSMASGLVQDARTALNVSSDSLLGKAAGTSAAATTAQQNLFDKSQLNLMSSYSRSGAYNMLNFYAVGSMMNYFI